MQPDRRAVAVALSTDPGVLADAAEAAVAREREATLIAADRRVVDVARRTAVDRSMPSIGDPRAPVVVEFMDYDCPHCRTFGVVADRLVAEGAIRLVVVESPILGDASRRMAEFAAAASLQGRFAPAHRFLLAHGAPDPAAAEALRPALVAEAGLDRTAFDAALSDGRAVRLVAKSVVLADAAGLVGTPMVVAGGSVSRGATDRARLLSMLGGS